MSADDMFTTHYDDEQIDRASERDMNRVLDELDFEKLVNGVEGRRFIRRLLAETGVNSQSYAGDTHLTAYREGRRSIGLWIYDLFKAYPDGYIKLIKETNNDD